jgi:hypothetical protein
MNPDRWEQIETLYRAAREKKPEERDAFLADTCGDDADWRCRSRCFSGRIPERPGKTLPLRP